MNKDGSTEFFQYQRGKMHCEGVPLEGLARLFGTPLYVTSAGAVRSALGELRRAFARFDPLVCFAVKANPSLALIRLLAREGCGADVVSGGELFRALRAGVPAGRIVFAGVGKTRGEMLYALKCGILMFNVESEEELRTLDAVARSARRRAPVAIRVNPRVDAHTHKHITTGTEATKFGVDIARAPKVFALASRLRGIDLKGVHTHIGSQILAPGAFVETVRRINRLVDGLERAGIRLHWRNLGGGLGVSYRPGEGRMDARALAGALGPALAHAPYRIVLETGRYLVGEAGILLVRVINMKRGARKSFAVTDGAMTELIRPALYEAHHEICAVAPRPGSRAAVDVVGPVCESSDFLGQARRLPPLRAGDLLAVMTAGAYGSSMASNYNSRRRPAEVLVDGRKARLVRRRDSLADLIRGESF